MFPHSVNTMKASIQMIIGIFILCQQSRAQTEVGINSGYSSVMLTKLGTEFVNNNKGFEINLNAEKRYNVVAVQVKLFYINNTISGPTFEHCYEDGRCYATETIIQAFYKPFVSLGGSGNLKFNFFNNFYFLSLGLGFSSTRIMNYSIQTLYQDNYAQFPLSKTITYVNESNFALATVYCFNNGVRIPFNKNLGLTLELSYIIQTLNPLVKYYINESIAKNPVTPFTKTEITVGVFSVSGGLYYRIGKIKLKS